MVFNTAFNNISIILWRSVLFVTETGVPRQNYKLYQIMLYRVHLDIKYLMFHIMFIINSLASYFVLYKNERNYILQDIINTEISMII